METTVNERIMMLKSELGLTDVEFCGKASISTATFQKIRKGEEVSRRVVLAICTGHSINMDWLLHGKGDKRAAIIENDSPYKDALVSELKSQVTYLQEMLRMALGGKVPANFKLLLAKLGLLEKTGRELREAA